MPGDVDVVPETATKVLGADYDRFHVGRGGEGNVHREEKEGGKKRADGGTEGMAEKAKEMVGLGKK